MEQREALGLLDEVRRVRRRTRTEIGRAWFPLVLFGVLSLLSTPLNGQKLGLYWAVAMPVGVALTALVFSRRERAVGVETRLAPTAVAIAVIVVGTAVTGSLGGALGAEMVSAVGPILAVAAGLLIFARIGHSPLVGSLALAMAALAVALVILGVAPATAASVLAAATGAASVFVGLALRHREQ